MTQYQRSMSSEERQEMNTLIAEINVTIQRQGAILRLQPIDYDRRTDVINPIGKSYSGRSIAPYLATSFDGLVTGYYTIVEPVMGWAPYTHVINWDDTAVYALAQLEEE